jgi:hypothetical protein
MLNQVQHDNIIIAEIRHLEFSSGSEELTQIINGDTETSLA